MVVLAIAAVSTLPIVAAAGVGPSLGGYEGGSGGEGQPVLGVRVAQSRTDPLAAGVEALRRGDLSAAVEQLEAAVAARPDDPEAHFYLGLARLESGDPGTAVEALRQARRLGPGFNANVTYQLGVALMRSGDFEAARREFGTLLERDPDAPQPHLNLGWMLLQEDRGAAALAIFEAVATDHPASATPRYWIAFVHHADGNFAEARAAYEEALELDPRLVEARLGLGRLLLTVGEPETARRMLLQVTEQRPDLAEARFQLGLLELRQDDVEMAIRHLEAAVALDPEHQGALYNLGRAYARAGRAIEGRAELSTFAALEEVRRGRQRQELRAQAESRAEAHYRRGVAALGRADADAAVVEFTAAIETAGDERSAEMHLGLGSGLLQTGRIAEARRALEAAVELDAELAAAHRLLAEAYALLGLDDLAEQARETYERLLAKRRK